MFHFILAIGTQGQHSTNPLQYNHHLKQSLTHYLSCELYFTGHVGVGFGHMTFDPIPMMHLPSIIQSPPDMHVHYNMPGSTKCVYGLVRVMMNTH